MAAAVAAAAVAVPVAAVVVAVAAADAGRRSNALRRNENPAVCKHRGVFFCLFHVQSVTRAALSALSLCGCQRSTRSFRDFPHRFGATAM